MSADQGLRSLIISIKEADALATQLGCNPRRVETMLQRRGGDYVKLMTDIIRNPELTSAMVKLVRAGHWEMTFEAIALKFSNTGLFDKATLEVAIWKLRQVGCDVTDRGALNELPVDPSTNEEHVAPDCALVALKGDDGYPKLSGTPVGRRCQMTWGFERGRTYNRRRDIHARFGGQQQGGIITPAEHPVVIIITGEEGGQHGYTDNIREDGVFEYFGEGQIGDMQLIRGNRAIAEHSKEGKALLMFRKVARDGSLRFEGEWICEDVLRRPGPDRDGAVRTALVFELRSIETVSEVEEDAAPASDTTSIEELRLEAIAAASIGRVVGTSPRNVFARSRAVHSYVLRRAGGHCEGCGSPAPFLRADGSPYLEPHHIRRLSDGGPDDIRFVIALCPNCHRRVHVGADGQSYNEQLRARMGSIEPS
ncbi:HNH endonuclease [Xanthobacter flavus]|uniref:HNH endonuclease n=1 Tax=Xanthobacter flavus TaxID=281 RepID=UPI001D8FCCCC|nr:HNH endonuclease [Xanthobacter flavus]MBP2147415.1 hypothetical protein [Xanthobacter flavus]